MGHKSYDAGADFEDAIDNRLNVLQQLGIIGRWQKNGPTFRQVGFKGGAPIYRRTEASGADRSGHFANGALTFAIEAKSTGHDPDGKLKYFTKEERIPENQSGHLDAVSRDGGLALLALRFCPKNQPWEIFIIPWFDVPWEKARINHRVYPALLQRWKLRQGDHLLERFLATCPNGKIGLAKQEDPTPASL